MRHRGRSIGVLLVGVLVIAGCATLGPAFQPVSNISEGMGLIYIYRESAFIGGGVSYDVKVGDTVVTTLHNGGYYPYLVKPGEVELWAKTEAKSAVTVDVKAGEVYYVKGEVGVGFWVGRPHLRVVPREKGEREIKECKLIPEAKSEAK
jgi:Protein of unknown function (DUF2846)